MNQDSNNLNSNNSNFQNSNVNYNNQPLNQGYNQNINPYQQPINEVNQSNFVHQQSVQPTNIQQSKQPNKKNTKLIIGIIIAAVVIILGIIFIPKMFNKNIEMNENNTLNKSTSIKYINSKKSKQNKIAFLIKDGLDIEYVLTIDLDQNFSIGDDYLLDLYNLNLKAEIKSDYRFKFELNGLHIDIDDDDVDDDDTILKQKDNWYLVKWSSTHDYTYICLKLQNPKYSWKEDWISFDITDNDTKDLNSQYFDKLMSMVNVYIVENNSGNFTFKDFNNNSVDLSDYSFINDSIANSLTKHDIYLKNPIGITTDITEINYETDDDLYFIELCDENDYKNEITAYQKETSFNYNNITYEMYSLPSRIENTRIYNIIYRKIDDKYLKISKYVNSDKSLDSIKNDYINDIL